MLVISLQFNTALTHKMNNGFSLTQLMENIFVPEAYATNQYGVAVIVIGTGNIACCPSDRPNCDPKDPDWEPCR